MRLVTGVAMAVAALVVVPTVASAQAGRTQVNEGNRLYAEGRFDEAHEKYLEALRDSPDSPLALFNDGNALYQTEEFQRALDAYRQAIESGDPGLAAPAWYNLGNALYRQQSLEESLEAYKQALRADPADFDYKHNLERVLEQLQQQEQQQQQDGEGDPDDENEDQNQDQDQQQEQGQGEKNFAPEERRGLSQAYFNCRVGSITVYKRPRQHAQTGGEEEVPKRDL